MDCKQKCRFFDPPIDLLGAVTELYMVKKIGSYLLDTVIPKFVQDTLAAKDPKR
jgi:hypothetical protein